MIDKWAYQNLLRRLNEANERVVEFERIKRDHLKYVDKLNEQIESLVSHINGD